MLKPGRGGVAYSDGQFDDARLNLLLASTAGTRTAGSVSERSVTTATSLSSQRSLRSNGSRATGHRSRLRKDKNKLSLFTPRDEEEVRLLQAGKLTAPLAPFSSGQANRLARLLVEAEVP